MSKIMLNIFLANQFDFVKLTFNILILPTTSDFNVDFVNSKPEIRNPCFDWAQQSKQIQIFQITK